MGNLEAETVRLLRAGLEGGAEALPFAMAVVAQVAHPPGHRGARPERPTAEGVLGLLRDAVRGDERAAGALVADPVLLAAVFQNVDLLYAHGAASADAVSAMILRALERAQGPAP